jgi:hypothetical protein
MPFSFEAKEVAFWWMLDFQNVRRNFNEQINPRVWHLAPTWTETNDESL